MGIDDDDDDNGASRTVANDEFTKLLGVMSMQAQQQATMMQQLINNQKALQDQLINLHQNQNQSGGTPNIPTYHIMPDLTKNINHFDGNDDGGFQAKNWIENLESMAKLHSWPEAFVLETARSHLKAAARHWYEGKQTELDTWPKFRDAFKKTFGNEETLAERWKRMEGRCQQKGESLVQYFHEKVALCRKLNLSFSDIRERVLVGLWSENLCTTVLARQHQDADDLLHDLQTCERINQSRLERIRGARHVNIPNNSRKPEGRNEAIRRDNHKPTSDKVEGRNLPNRDSKGEPKCFNCNEYGHLSKACPKPRTTLKCRICNVEGHLARNCTTSQKPEPKSEVTVVENVKQTNSSVKDVLINECMNVTGLIDTGSAVCLIKRSIADRCNLEPQAIQRQLYAYGKTRSPAVEVTSMAKCKLRIDDVNEEVEVLIVDDDIQTYDLIVGQTFIGRDRVRFLKVDSGIRFAYNDEWPFSSMELQCESTNKLRVTKNQAIKGGEVNLVELEADDGEQCMMMIRNVSNKDLELMKGKCIQRMTTNSSDRKMNDVMVIDEVNDDDKTTITEDLLHIDEGMSKNDVKDLLELVNEFRGTFALNLTELGCTNEVQMTIRDTDVPVRSKPYKANAAERETIARIVKEWKDNNIVSETHSEYASPVILVKKKNGDPRLVIDFRKLNAQTKKMPFPIPSIDEQFECLTGCKLFTVLDLANGYLQIPIDQQSRHKTAFITPDETGEFNRMMFGLTNAPYEFCRLMNTVLGPLKNTTCVWYIDDVLVGAHDMTDMINRLREIFERFRVAKLTLNVKKCKFGLTEVEFVGMRVSSEGLKPGTTKTDAIREFARPRDVHELRRYLGLTSYFRRFIPKFAERSRVLSNLTKAQAKFEWTSECESAFLELKNMLIRAPVLRLFNPNASVTELHTDASSYGLAGILLQSDDQGRLHPVYYVSKKTTEVESKYHSSKLELMAVVWCIERLRNFLIGLKFDIVTDCQALVAMNSLKSKNAQICRWFSTLQEYTFTVKHRPGKRMAHVDALSRSPSTTEEKPTESVIDRLEVCPIMIEEDYILMIQNSDPSLRELIQIFKKPEEERTPEESNKIKNYSFEDSKLYRNLKIHGKEKMLYVLPNSVRKSMVVRCHDLLGHFGVDRTVNKIMENYWFAKMRNYVKRHIQACPECLLTKIPAGRQPGELHPYEPPRRPFERVHIDHIGPLITTENGQTYVLVVIDALTKFVTLYAVEGTTSNETIRRLQDFVDTYGISRRMVTDRATCFTSEEFEDWCQKKGIRHSLISSRWAQSNGQVERVMRTLIPTIMTEMEDDEHWDEKLCQVQRNLNTHVNETTNKTPFEMLYGYLPEFHDGRLRNTVTEDPPWEPPIAIREEVRQRIREQQKKQKKRYDKHRYQGVKYHLGDIVVMKRAPISTGQSTKLQPKYRGPMEIIQLLPNDTYRVANMETNGRYFTTTANVAQLKLYRNATESEEETEEQEEIEEEEMTEEREDIEEEEGTEQYTEEVQEEKNTVRKRKRPDYLKDYCLQ